MEHRIVGETHVLLSIGLWALLIDLTSYLTKEEFLGKVSPAFKPSTDEQTTRKATYGENGKSLAALIWMFINNQTNKEVVKSIACISE